MNKPGFSLEQQRRLLQSLGFGFVEEPLPEPPPGAEPVETSNHQRGKKRTPAPPSPAKEVPPRPAAAPLSSLPSLPREERVSALEVIAGEAAACRACALHLTRNQAVAGHGNPEANVFIVREIPDETLDRGGGPFEGEIGKMFSDIIKATGLTEDDCYISYAAKCHPLATRPPRPEELDACRPYLERQIEIVRPAILICFGLAAAASLLPETTERTGFQRLRGQWQEYRGIPLMPTFPLPYIHRNKARKRLVWQDLQKVIEKRKG